MQNAGTIGLSTSAGNISRDDGLSSLSGVIGDQTGYSGRLAQQGDGASDDQYDLLGLLKVLKMTNLSLNILAFGTDLTTLGKFVCFYPIHILLLSSLSCFALLVSSFLVLFPCTFIARA